jgi:hypothetical protein
MEGNRRNSIIVLLQSLALNVYIRFQLFQTATVHQSENQSGTKRAEVKTPLVWTSKTYNRQKGLGSFFFTMIGSGTGAGGGGGGMTLPT